MNIRKERPLARGRDALRDDSLIIVACDDRYAPKQYFGFFQVRGVHVHVEPVSDDKSHPKHVLQSLLEIEHEKGDERWLLLDTDHLTTDGHVHEFMLALEEARRLRVRIALSSPCFEFWLLLHHSDGAELNTRARAEEVERALRKAAGSYNKTRLREEDYPPERVVAACKRAERIDGAVAGGDRPQSNTTRVYQLWHSILTNALPWQLPAPLAEYMRHSS